MVAGPRRARRRLEAAPTGFFYGNLDFPDKRLVLNTTSENKIILDVTSDFEFGAADNLKLPFFVE